MCKIRLSMHRPAPSSKLFVLNSNSFVGSSGVGAAVRALEELSVLEDGGDFSKV
jgi:hypothetical protein